MRYIFSFILISTLLFAIPSCVNESLDPDPPLECTSTPTYDNEIVSIIDGSCAYSGCHDGSLNAPGDYSNYALLSSSLNESFENRVVTKRDMPPANAPDGYPKTLTEEELILIRCWIQAGYPEN